MWCWFMSLNLFSMSSNAQTIQPCWKYFECTVWCLLQMFIYLTVISSVSVLYYKRNLCVLVWVPSKYEHPVIYSTRCRSKPLTLSYVEHHKLFFCRSIRKLCTSHMNQFHVFFFGSLPAPIHMHYVLPEFHQNRFGLTWG